MKLRLLTLSALMAGACVTMSAQDNYYTEKWSDNIFVSGAVGIHSVNNDGFQKITPNFSVSLGKYITPVWATRVQLNGFGQHLMDEKQVLKDNHCKTFFGLNLDGMVNLTNLLGGIDTDRAFEVYGFAGPMLSFAKSQNVRFTTDLTSGDVTTSLSNNSKMHTRVGASVGLGFKYNINESLAVDLEARGGIAPSIFGNISSTRKAEGTLRVNLGLTYTFGGKNFKKVADRVIEKEVIREVPREVIKEVTKEVKVESPHTKAVAAAAVFFKIGKTDLSEEGKVNIKLIADAIKKSAPGVKYQVAGSADKATGSAALNQKLSEKRAQVVYDALIAEGVKAEQLEIVAKGGVDPLFFGIDKLSRVTVIECK